MSRGVAIWVKAAFSGKGEAAQSAARVASAAANRPRKSSAHRVRLTAKTP